MPSTELVPPRVVTVTSKRPATLVGGVTAVICVADTTVTDCSGSVPIFAVAPLIKPVPVIVIGVPPCVVPVAGVTDVTVGVAGV